MLNRKEIKLSKYEQLLAEYENSLDIEERVMVNKGLYSDDVIWLKRDMTDSEKLSILAEEIGHYETSSGDILDQTNVSNIKQENRARAWAYEKLLPLKTLEEMFNVEFPPSLEEAAEDLSVSIEFLVESMKFYKMLDI